MSHLLTAAAIDQNGANLNILGDLQMANANFIGVAATGCMITFDSSGGAVQIGDPTSGGASSILEFASSTSSKIVDANQASLIVFSPATSNASGNIKLTPGTTSGGTVTNTIIEIEESGLNGSLELKPKGSGLVRLQSTAASTGLQFSTHTDGTKGYTIQGPQSTHNNDASVTFPDIISGSEPTAGQVMKVASVSGQDVSLEFAADAGALTYNDVSTSTFNSATIAAGNIYAINDISSSITKALPSGSNGAKIKFIDANGGLSASNTLTLTPQTGEKVNGDATSVILDGAYQALELQYNATTANWNIV